MDSNEELLAQYNQWFSDHYREIYRKLQAYCRNKRIPWQEDYIQQTYLHTANSIIRNGRLDPSTLTDDIKSNNYLFIAARNTINMLNSNNAESRHMVSLEDMEDKDFVLARYAARGNRMSQTMDMHAKRERRCSLMDEILDDIRENFDDSHYEIFKRKCDGLPITRDSHNQQKLNRVIRYIQENYRDAYDAIIKEENEQNVK